MNKKPMSISFRPGFTRKGLSLPQRLDYICIFLASLVPIGVMVGPTVYEGSIALVCLLWIGRKIVVRDDGPVFRIGKAITIPYIFWFLTIVISLLVNVNFSGEAWGHDLGFVRFVIFVVAMLDISQRHNIVRPMIFGLIAFVIYGWFNYFMAITIGFDLVGKETIYYTGKLKTACRIATIGQFVVPFLAGWAILDKELSKANRLLLFTVSFFAMWLLVLTNIRSSVIAAVAGLLFIVFYWARRKIVLTSLLTACIGLVLVGIGYFIVTDVNLDSHLGSMYHRFDIWRVSIFIWLENPICGTSVAGFKAAFAETAVNSDVFATGLQFLPGMKPDAAHAHNLVIQLLTSTGLLGYLAFCWLFVSSCREIFTDFSGWRAGLFCWPIVFLFSGLVGANIYASDYQPLVVFFLVLIACKQPFFAAGSKCDDS